MPAFYSEFDPKAAAWLRELIKRGLIADGVVDERDLWDVAPDDLRDFTQVHLCAGIGVWSYALRQSGWPDDRPCWTASFPCQPFSAAGKGEGFLDERHLWPAGFHLIAQCRPDVIFGEQVASDIILGSGNEKLQKMLRDKAGIGVQALEPFAKWLPQRVQKVPVRGRTVEAQDEQNGSALREGISGEKPDSLRHNPLPADGCEEGLGLRSPPALRRIEPASDSRSLRVDGLPARLGRAVYAAAKAAERGVDRPDRLAERLRAEQRQSGLSRGQLSARDVGREWAIANFESLEREALNDEPEKRRAPEAHDTGVDAADREVWIDVVFDDLEDADYACAAVAFPSAGIGAPHIRDRTYWVADATLGGWREERADVGRVVGGNRSEGFAAGLEHGRDAGRLADDDDAGLEGRRQPGRERAAERLVGAGGVAGGLADADGRERDGQPVLRGAERDGPDAGRSQGGGQPGARRLDSGLGHTERLGAGRDAGAGVGPEGGYRGGAVGNDTRPSGATGHVGGHADPHGAGAQGEHGLREVAAHAGPVNGGWADADWIYCRNGEWRPVEPGTFPLAHGAPARVGRLRGYGNAVNASAAQAWIESYLEAREDQGA